MKYYELEKDEAQRLFDSISNKKTELNEEYFSKLDSEYTKIRNKILSWCIERPITKDYEFDLFLALKLHEFFSVENFPDFNEAIASNYGFWRYICLMVIPDVIIERHGLIKEYFYAKNVRLYISTLWWFIEMCFQGDYLKTYDCLKDKSTDYILQIVERPGRSGMFIDVSRLIIYYLSKLPEDVVNKQYNKQTLLRRVVIQNTAKNTSYNMVLEGKVKEYVIGLFRSCGVEVQEYGIE
jgi:hypothetical protein